MLKRSIALVLVTTLMLVTAVPLQTEAQGRSRDGLTVPVSGTATPEGGAAQPFTGTFTITRFDRAGDGIVAIGTLVATSVVDTATGATVSRATQVAWPLASAKSGAGPDASRAATNGVIAQQVGECDILTLVLGPLHLDLLGLVIDLNQVVLEITAVAGAGNLLGNLLCAIAGLLDPGGLLEGLLGNILNQIVAILNRILGAL